MWYLLIIEIGRSSQTLMHHRGIRREKMRKDELDKEWVTLMLEAKEIGLTIEEIRDYFAEKSKNSELETKKTVHG